MIHPADLLSSALGTSEPMQASATGGTSQADAVVDEFIEDDEEGPNFFATAMGIAKPKAKAKGQAKPPSRASALPSASPSPPASRGPPPRELVAVGSSASTTSKASVESPSKADSHISEQLGAGEAAAKKAGRGRPRAVVDLTSGAQKIHNEIKTEVSALEDAVSQLYEVKHCADLGIAKDKKAWRKKFDDNVNQAKAQLKKIDKIMGKLGKVPAGTLSDNDNARRTLEGWIADINTMTALLGSLVKDKPDLTELLTQFGHAKSARVRLSATCLQVVAHHQTEEYLRVKHFEQSAQYFSKDNAESAFGMPAQDRTPTDMALLAMEATVNRLVANVVKDDVVGNDAICYAGKAGTLTSCVTALVAAADRLVAWSELEPQMDKA